MLLILVTLGFFIELQLALLEFSKLNPAIKEYDTFIHTLGFLMFGQGILIQIWIKCVYGV